MVTYFNRKDLVSFGNYLLSDERKELYKSHPEASKLPSLEERLKEVNHSDVENWLDHGNRQKGKGFHAENFSQNMKDQSIEALAEVIKEDLEKFAEKANWGKTHPEMQNYEMESESCCAVPVDEDVPFGTYDDQLEFRMVKPKGRTQHHLTIKYKNNHEYGSIKLHEFSFGIIKNMIETVIDITGDPFGLLTIPQSPDEVVSYENVISQFNRLPIESPEEKVWSLLSKVDNQRVTKKMWDEADDFIKYDLRMTALLIIDEVLLQLPKGYPGLFDIKIGYWNEVKKLMEEI